MSELLVCMSLAAFASLRRSARDGRTRFSILGTPSELGVFTMKSEIVWCRVGVVLFVDELLGVVVEELELDEIVVVACTSSASLAR